MQNLEKALCRTMGLFSKSSIFFSTIFSPIFFSVEKDQTIEDWYDNENEALSNRIKDKKSKKKKKSKKNKSSKDIITRHSEMEERDNDETKIIPTTTETNPCPLNSNPENNEEKSNEMIFENDKIIENLSSNDENSISHLNSDQLQSNVLNSNAQ